MMGEKWQKSQRSALPSNERPLQCCGENFAFAFEGDKFFKKKIKKKLVEDAIIDF